MLRAVPIAKICLMYVLYTIAMLTDDRCKAVRSESLILLPRTSMGLYVCCALRKAGLQSGNALVRKGATETHV